MRRWPFFMLNTTNSDKKLTTLAQVGSSASFAMSFAGSYHLQGCSKSESAPKYLHVHG